MDSLVQFDSNMFALTGMSLPLSCQVIFGVGNPYEEQLNTASFPCVTVTDCGPVTLHGGTGSLEPATIPETRVSREVQIMMQGDRKGEVL